MDYRHHGTAVAFDVDLVYTFINCWDLTSKPAAHCPLSFSRMRFKITTTCSVGDLLSDQPWNDNKHVVHHYPALLIQQILVSSSTKEKNTCKSCISCMSFYLKPRISMTYFHKHTVDRRNPIPTGMYPKPSKQWDKLPTSTGEFTGFHPSNGRDSFSKNCSQDFANGCMKLWLAHCLALFSTTVNVGRGSKTTELRCSKFH